MNSVQLKSSEVTYLYSLLCCVQDRHAASLDDALLFESTEAEINVLTDKFHKLHLNCEPDKTCLQCGAPIQSTNPRKKTCSDACRQAWSRHIRSAVAAAKA